MGGKGNDYVIGGENSQQVQVKIYHMPVLVDAHLVQPMFMPYLKFCATEAASIWWRIPHHRLCIYRYRFWFGDDWGEGLSSRAQEEERGEEGVGENIPSRVIYVLDILICKSNDDGLSVLCVAQYCVVKRSWLI